MKRCKIPSGCKLPHRPCCADCEDKTCEKRCWNSPERCGCWTEVSPDAQDKKQGRPHKFDWDEIKQLYQRGVPMVGIAARIGASVSTVETALKKMGVKRRG